MLILNYLLSDTARYSARNRICSNLTVAVMPIGFRRVLIGITAHGNASLSISLDSDGVPSEDYCVVGPSIFRNG